MDNDNTQDPVDRIRQDLGLGSDASDEIASAIDLGPDTPQHRQRLANIAAATIGDIAKVAPELEDVRTIVGIMSAAVHG